ncbi:uncharacterized protein BXIN_2564 [Babesia sp. Xinjiang]|uniref:uncharacterized protein n=1 Tax=Babesia sp. Xinjiang TaxID=462227 RepID=UPI000A23AC32|nr:uncharacterized protein BXIN_2564 [Babesia sp. Xinjiang]ORM41472.1 hypothetical protein BXIN_2564 [Babesia sp. Xinjiang]
MVNQGQRMFASRFSLSSLSQFYSSNSDSDDEDSYSDTHSSVTLPRRTNAGRIKSSPGDEGDKADEYTLTKENSKLSQHSPELSMNSKEVDQVAGVADTPLADPEPRAASMSVASSAAEGAPSVVSASNSIVSARATVTSHQSDHTVTEHSEPPENHHSTVPSVTRSLSPTRESGAVDEEAASDKGDSVVDSLPVYAPPANDLSHGSTHGEQSPRYDADEDVGSVRSDVVKSEYPKDGNVATLSSLDAAALEALINSPSEKIVDNAYIRPPTQVNDVANASSRSNHTIPAAVTSVNNYQDGYHLSQSSKVTEKVLTDNPEAVASECSYKIEPQGHSQEDDYHPSDTYSVSQTDMPISPKMSTASEQINEMTSVANEEVSFDIQRPQTFEQTNAISVSGSCKPVERNAGSCNVPVKQTADLSPAIAASAISPSESERQIFIDIGEEYREVAENPNLISTEATPIHKDWGTTPGGVRDLAETSDSTPHLATSFSSDSNAVVEQSSVKDFEGGHPADHESVVEVDTNTTAQESSIPEEEYSLTKQLSREVDRYKEMYAQLERKVTDIWNQREAFRVANDRIAANLARNSGAKSVRFEDHNIDTDEDASITRNLEAMLDCGSAHSPGRPSVSPRDIGMTADDPNAISSIMGSRSYNLNMEVASDDVTTPSGHSYSKSHEPPRGVRCNRQTMERLLNCGVKLYALRLITSGVRSETPLYMDVCPRHSAYNGKVILSNNVGLFKISLVKPPTEAGSSVGSVLSYLRLDSEQSSVDYLYGIFSSIAEYVGLSWMSSESSQPCYSSRMTEEVSSRNEDAPPHVQIKYMHSLVNASDSMVMVDDGFPSNCNIGAMFHGQHEHLFCVEETRELRKSDLQNNSRFTFILDTSPSTGSKHTASRRFNSNVYLVNSVTREYLCVDLLTHELRFAGGPCTRAYSKYVVPATFKMVRLYNVLAEKGPGLQGTVSEASEYTQYRRCVSERAAARHGYELPRSASRMVDVHGNFLPMTLAAGTPAPSPRHGPSTVPSQIFKKDCVLLSQRDNRSVNTQPADMYDIADSGDFGSSDPSARSESRAVEMYNMLEPTSDERRPTKEFSSMQSTRGPAVKDLKMKFEKLSSRSRLFI